MRLRHRAGSEKGGSPQTERRRRRRLLAPIVVGGGDRLEIDGNDLRCRHEGVGIFRIDGTKFFQHLRVRLRVLDAAPAQRNCKLKPGLRGVRDECREPCVSHCVNLPLKCKWCSILVFAAGRIGAGLSRAPNNWHPSLKPLDRQGSAATRKHPDAQAPQGPGKGREGIGTEAARGATGRERPDECRIPASRAGCQACAPCRRGSSMMSAPARARDVPR